MGEAASWAPGESTCRGVQESPGGPDASGDLWSEEAPEWRLREQGPGRAGHGGGGHVLSPDGASDRRPSPEGLGMTAGQTRAPRVPGFPDRQSGGQGSRGRPRGWCLPARGWLVHPRAFSDLPRSLLSGPPVPLGAGSSWPLLLRPLIYRRRKPQATVAAGNTPEVLILTALRVESSARQLCSPLGFS